MAIFPSKFIRNPIPFALSLSSQAPITLPLLSRAQVPGPSVVLQKTKATLREEHLAHNPVKLLADARAQAEERALFKGKGSSFPRNLKIESLLPRSHGYGYDEPTLPLHTTSNGDDPRHPLLRWQERPSSTLSDVSKAQELHLTQFLSLTQHLPSLEVFDLSGYLGIGWSDWPSTIVAFSSLSRPMWLVLSCSLTPLPTLVDTITCAACASHFPTTHPQLNRDLQLVGGRDALWTLLFEIKVARLHLLADHRPKGSEVEWNVNQYNPGIHTLLSVVRFRAHVVVNEEDTSRKLVQRGRGEMRGPREREDSPCWTCSGNGEEDPIEKLRRCSVEEVRAAMAKRGFDFGKFDARSGAPHVDN
ncbi:hypothetical protein BDY24DRAFT_414516 [Mrakia frigida]|uniref:uncharacterized protein n=1 Tax=Mrakia frigida TaxID=29902 RepID=UPI003FCC2130